jgi:Spy/CpxP family protein refolding chaperone
MKAENKHNLMVWAIVVLAVMNISTLATILYHQYQSKETSINTTQAEQQLETNAERFSGRYFRDKLDLNSDQMDKFREFNPVFRQQARAITLELASLRKQMLAEMTAPNSDTSTLNALSDSIGYLHGNLKKLTYKYYLDMKSICNTAQQKQLEQLFSKMFTNDAPMGFPGKGGRGGGQHGRRFNK